MLSMASLMVQMVKNLPSMQETRIDPWVGTIPWRRTWQPTPVFLPGESHGWNSLGGYNSQDHTTYWSFSFSISTSNEQSGLIFFRIDWLALLAVQGTLKSLLQHHSSKTSILQQLSLLSGPTLTSVHDYWKNHSFDCMDICQQSDVSAFEYTIQVCHSFFSKEQASFNFRAAVTIYNDFGAQGNKICHYSIFPPSVCHEVMRPDAMILVF